MWVDIYDFFVGLCCGGRQGKDIKHLALEEYNELLEQIKDVKRKSKKALLNCLIRYSHSSPPNRAL